MKLTEELHGARGRRDWRVWLIYDQRDGAVFAVGASPAGVGQPRPDNVSEKLKTIGRHAKVMELASGLTEAEATQIQTRWLTMPGPVLPGTMVA